jgi:hypothetical protein
MSPHHREDESLDESQVKMDRRMSPFRVFVSFIAVLLILGGIVWIAEMVGLLTAVLPAGPWFFEGWLWGILGIFGLILLGIILLNARRET